MKCRAGFEDRHEYSDSHTAPQLAEEIGIAGGVGQLVRRHIAKRGSVERRDHTRKANAGERGQARHQKETGVHIDRMDKHEPDAENEQTGRYQNVRRHRVGQASAERKHQDHNAAAGGQQPAGLHRGVALYDLGKDRHDVRRAEQADPKDERNRHGAGKTRILE